MYIYHIQFTCSLLRSNTYINQETLFILNVATDILQTSSVKYLLILVLLVSEYLLIAIMKG